MSVNFDERVGFARTRPFALRELVSWDRDYAPRRREVEVGTDVRMITNRSWCISCALFSSFFISDG